MVKGYKRPPSAIVSSWSDPLRGSFNLLDWLFRQPMAGKLNAVGSVTLTANAATTVYTDPRLGGESYIGLMPTTANAAADVGAAGSVWIDAQGDGTATIHHPNNANADKTYTTLIIG